MTNSNPDVDGGGGETAPVLQQEARTALSGRVPLAMSIVLALLSGMLVGYGVRALTAGSCAQREVRCPRKTGARILVMPNAAEQRSDCSKARLHLLQEPAPAPGSAAPAMAGGSVDDATDGDVAGRKAPRDQPRATRDAPAARKATVDKPD